MFLSQINDYKSKNEATQLATENKFAEYEELIRDLKE